MQVLEEAVVVVQVAGENIARPITRVASSAATNPVMIVSMVPTGGVSGEIFTLIWDELTDLYKVEVRLNGKKLSDKVSG